MNQDYAPKKRLDMLYQAFYPYIKECSFDVVWTEKFGYILLRENERGQMYTVRLRTWREMLKYLCREMVVKVIVPLEKIHPQRVTEEVCQSVRKILSSMEANQEELIVQAEKYIHEFFGHY